MPRKKSPRKNQPRTPPGSSGVPSSGGGFFHFFISRPMRQLYIVAAVFILLAVYRERLDSFFRELRIQLGWGLVIIVIALMVLIVMAFRRQFGSFIRHWNYWLAAIVFAIAIWGVLGTFQTDPDGMFPKGLGGLFGRHIVNYPDLNILYALRIFALVLLGFVLAAPRLAFRIIKAIYFWIYDQIRKPRAATRPTRTTPPSGQRIVRGPLPGERTTTPIITTDPLVPPEVTSSRKRLEELAKKAAALKPGATMPPEAAPVFEPGAVIPVRSEPRQIADEIWKKYGEAGNLVEIDGWHLPPIDILDISPEVQFSQADNLQRANLIEDTLASYGVDAKVVQINAGPTVTQFGVEPGWDRKFKEVKEKDRDGNVQVKMEEISKTRVKVERISSLSNDLALALAAPTIRIEAPVPGKTYVGVEVPNTTSDMVSLRGVVESSPFQKLVSKTRMSLALGKGAGGEAVAADLTKMPHLLIAGATGSGKTVCLNTVVCCLLLYNTPNDVRFILIDPKRVELTQYNSIPHLATPVIVDTDKAISALRWLLDEMDQRYKKLAAAGARHIEGYNKGRQGTDKLPYLVLIIDELADLMMAGSDEVESSLCRLAQLARATGIHLVVATQRPSVDVVTGLIKANFPTRISFAVTSQVDSRTILDGAGAEKLLGRGDMLYMPTEAAKPKRLQGCFLSDPEIERLVYFWGSQRKETPDKLRMETLVATTPSGTIGGHPRDPLLEQAKELAKQYSDVSTSFLQRKLHIGYPRAARLKEQLDAVLSNDTESEAINEETGPQEKVPE
jgi:S-DNA-T family DNA segregation ATPase FtsK/SpoIIIE